MKTKNLGGLFICLMLLLPVTALACPICDSETGTLVRAGIFNGAFLLNFAAGAIPIVLIFLLIPFLARRRFFSEHHELVSAGLFLGTGLGGFLDGIILHQIFQVHNMVSGQIFPDDVVSLEVNMFWDGIFHLMCFALTSVGLWKLWNLSAVRRDLSANRILGGTLLLGWGLFNFTEGFINHQLLGLHHVNERLSGGDQLFYDLVFLWMAVLQIFSGLFIIKGLKRNLSATGVNFTSGNWDNNRSPSERG